MTETTFQKLSRAIKEKKQISFEYHNPSKPYEWGSRIGNPHIIYIQNNTHNRIDIVQLSGEGTNNPSLLKQFLIEQIKNVQVLDNTFSICQMFNSNAPRYLKKLVDINENAN